MNNLIKSVIGFWLTTSLISIIIFILLWSLNLTPASWNKYILEILVNQLDFSISNNIFLPIFGALLCLVVLYLVRVFLKITINISAIILSIIFLIYFSLYLSKSWSSAVLNIKDIAPFIILLCFAAIVLIINQLIYLEKIRLPNFLKRIFKGYFTLSIGVIVILFFQILVKDADKLNRAWDNHLVLTNYFNSYTKMECTLLSEIKSGMSANYNTKRMEFYNDFHDYANDKPFIIKVMLSESEYRGENLIRYMFVLYEPYDAVRYKFMTPYSQYISLAKPDDLKIFKGKTSIVFRRLDTDEKAFYELEFDTQTNEMIIKEKNFLEKINYETNNIPEWKKKFYEKSLGELVSESSQQLQCNYN